MTSKVEFPKYNINVIDVVQFMFKNVKSCKSDVHEQYRPMNNRIKQVLFSVEKNKIKQCELDIARVS